jgi:hypothetical protein
LLFVVLPVKNVHSKFSKVLAIGATPLGWAFGMIAVGNCATMRRVTQIEVRADTNAAAELHRARR